MRASPLTPETSYWPCLHTVEYISRYCRHLSSNKQNPNIYSYKGLIQITLVSTKLRIRILIFLFLRILTPGAHIPTISQLSTWLPTVASPNVYVGCPCCLYNNIMSPLLSMYTSSHEVNGLFPLISGNVSQRFLENTWDTAPNQTWDMFITIFPLSPFWDANLVLCFPVEEDLRVQRNYFRLSFHMPLKACPVWLELESVRICWLFPGKEWGELIIAVHLSLN